MGKYAAASDLFLMNRQRGLSPADNSGGTTIFEMVGMGSQGQRHKATLNTTRIGTIAASSMEDFKLTLRLGQSPKECALERIMHAMTYTTDGS